MALEPEEVMREVGERARSVTSDPPRLLEHPPGTGAPMSPLREDEDMAAMHRHWAEAHEAEQAPPEASVRVRALARVTAVAGGGTQAQRADRYLIGDLIRAVDALARRVDEIGERLRLVEALVDELVVVTGEDTTRIRAALIDAGQTGPEPGTAAGDDV